MGELDPAISCSLLNPAAREEGAPCVPTRDGCACDQSKRVGSPWLPMCAATELSPPWLMNIEGVWGAIGVNRKLLLLPPELPPLVTPEGLPPRCGGRSTGMRWELEGVDGPLGRAPLFPGVMDGSGL